MNSFGTDNTSWAATAASDARLSAPDLRVLLAFLACRLQTGKATVPLAELGRVAGLDPAAARTCVSALAAAGYLASADGGESAGPGRRMLPPHRSNGAKPARRARLESGIIKPNVDLERLKRAGDQLNRQLIHAATAASPMPGSSATRTIATWNPIDGEAAQPAALRFRVWLQVVLTPEELDLCRSWETRRPEAWASWVDRFSVAKATGREADFLDGLRRQFGTLDPEPRPDERLS